MNFLYGLEAVLISPSIKNDQYEEKTVDRIWLSLLRLNTVLSTGFLIHLDRPAQAESE